MTRYGVSGCSTRSIQRLPAGAAPRAGWALFGDGRTAAGACGWPPASRYVHTVTAWSEARNVATTRTGVWSPLTTSAVTPGTGGASEAKWPPASGETHRPPWDDPPPSLATYSRSARRGDTASELTSVAGSTPPPVSCCQLAPASRVANRPVFVPMSSDREAWLLARAATMLLPPITAPGAPT